MPNASELARQEAERDPHDDPLPRDYKQAYHELRERADRMGFHTVHAALDALEALRGGPTFRESDMVPSVTGKLNG